MLRSRRNAIRMLVAKPKKLQTDLQPAIKFAINN